MIRTRAFRRRQARRARVRAELLILDILGHRHTAANENCDHVRHPVNVRRRGADWVEELIRMYTVDRTPHRSYTPYDDHPQVRRANINTAEQLREECLAL